MKKTKKIIILSSIFLLSILSITFMSLKNNKVNAADNYFIVDISDTSEKYCFYISFYSGSAYDLFYISADDTNYRSILTITNSNGYYIVNNNENYIIYTDYLYLFVYENTINHFLVYLVDNLTDASSSSEVDLQLLFTISGTTGDYSSLKIYSQFIQFYSHTNDISENNLQSIIYSRYNSTGFIDTIIAEGYSSGYSAGYDVGYDAGQEGETAITPFFNILSGIFTSIGAVFSIELIPNVPIGLFFLVPLFFAIVGLILFIWRKNF